MHHALRDRLGSAPRLLECSLVLTVSRAEWRTDYGHRDVHWPRRQVVRHCNECSSAPPDRSGNERYDRR
ncbi:uncharacterized protein STEHIDRAFT_147014 [Stereum hirsutum FP-91666 SS1]|uniref:uncharacterized protein n=1 Tax=Stereum hirsutum (strain FP-91666) TaxID=721885 RepID=UPI000440D10B|nr:uncharacterized protein STEHIDRAFT_147014 [Stereum hirsutum FP-91666 SS1]EIM86359.1 hypothetical protein STEHIDRAFT_147014 [Stereum hirsutum FP-91666 SS1]